MHGITISLMIASINLLVSLLRRLFIRSVRSWIDVMEIAPIYLLFKGGVKGYWGTERKEGTAEEVGKSLARSMECLDQNSRTLDHFYVLVITRIWSVSRFFFLALKKQNLKILMVLLF